MNKRHICVISFLKNTVLKVEYFYKYFIKYYFKMNKTKKTLNAWQTLRKIVLPLAQYLTWAGIIWVKAHLSLHLKPVRAQPNLSQVLSKPKPNS